VQSQGRAGAAAVAVGRGDDDFAERQERADEGVDAGVVNAVIVRDKDSHQVSVARRD
jgi:hypothetical protein